MKTKEIINPIWVRIYHWVHAISIVMLIITGIQIRFPDLFNIFGNLKRAIHYHNLFGFIVLLDYLSWYSTYLINKDFKKQYIPTKQDFLKGIPSQAYYYLFGYFLGDPAPFEPKPEAKFNPLQKTAYFIIMIIFLPLQIISGVLLWNINFFRPVIDILGGVRVVDGVHIILAYIFICFLLAHLYLATLGHTVYSHFKAMILGYE